MINKIKKYLSIIQIPIKLIIIILMIFVSYEYLNKVFINKDVNYGDDFRELPENSLDVLVLGSSDAQYSFVPSFFFEDTGLYSYVRGTACQPLEVSYELLKESLKTQKPKIVFLEVFTAMPLRSICEDDVCYVLAQYEMTGQEKYNTINYLPEEKAKEYRNDFINYHNDWRTRTDYESILPSNVNRKDGMPNTYFGYVYQTLQEFPKNYWLPTVYDKDIDVALDQLDQDSLNNIYYLCKEKNIELVLYKTPIDSMTQEDQSMLHKVWEWADKNEIKYIDFVSLAEGINFYMQIHSDSFHCNINGASILTSYIADFVNDNFDVKHIQNFALDRLYKTEVWSLTKNAVTTEFDPLVYLRRLKNTEGLICIRYNPQKDKYISIGLYNLVCGMGCTYFDINYNYYAIIKDGELIYESGEPISFDYDGKKIIINDELISIGDSTYDTYGLISIVYSNDNNIEEGLIKNIDYNPFPWDYNEKVYIR